MRRSFVLNQYLVWWTTHRGKSSVCFWFAVYEATASRYCPSPPMPSYHAFPDVVGAIYPTLITKSPNRSPSSRSRAYRLIIGFRIDRISGSVTVSGNRMNNQTMQKNIKTNLGKFYSAADRSNLHRVTSNMFRELCQQMQPL